MNYLDILDGSLGGAIASPVRGTLASKPSEQNPDHHLWNNRGTWWCHFTLHLPDYTSERVRVSLKTADVVEARRRRDELLAAFRG